MHCSLLSLQLRTSQTQVKEFKQILSVELVEQFLDALYCNTENSLRNHICKAMPSCFVIPYSESH